MSYSTMGSQILKWKYACGSKDFVRGSWKKFCLKMGREPHKECDHHSGRALNRYYQITNKKTTQKLELVEG